MVIRRAARWRQLRRSAARHYGLDVLAENVEDRPDNQTRFLVVALRTSAAETRRGHGSHKTALVFETDNRPGALLDVLKPFARRRINFSKLESRPGAEPWTYRFFLEIEEGADGDAADQAIAEARQATRHLHVLGTYAPWTGAVHH